MCRDRANIEVRDADGPAGTVTFEEGRAMKTVSAMTRATVPMRAVVYCRVSTAGQEDNSSLETQEQRCRAHATERGWEVINHFREVHTGSELFERPQLSRLRETLRANEADIVLAYALDRVSRNQAHLGFLLSEWDHLGVRLELVTEAFDETPEGRLLQSVRGFVAEMERLKIRERAQRGVRARVDSGKPIPGRKAPFGYHWRDAEKTAFDLDATAAPIVRRIFNGILQGQTLRSLAITLTTEGVPTPTGRGRRWEVTTIHQIVKHPIYTGRAVAYRTIQQRCKGKTRAMLRPESDWVALPDGIAPPIVTKEEFAAVQDRLARNKLMASRNATDPEATLLRAGFARCGYCHHPLGTLKRPNRPYLYRCHPVNQQRYGCPSFGIVSPILDNAVWDKVEAVLTRPAIIAAEVTRRLETDAHIADVDALDRRLAILTEQRSRLARAVATVNDEEATAPLLAELKTLAHATKVLTGERTALIARATELDVDRQRLADLAAWCSRVAGNLPTLSYQEKRMVLEALGVRVLVYRVDHDPRWEITMAPLPVEQPTESSPVFGNAKAF
jgi:site-specific DNA recombinase